MRSFDDELLRELVHEVRTPLTVVEGYLRLALQLVRTQHQQPSDEQLEIIDLFLAKALDGHEQVVQLLTDVNSPNEQFPWNPERVELASTVQDAVLTYLALMPNRHLQFEKELHQDMYVWVDPLRLQQVVSNLLNNALSYSALTVKVRVSVEGEHVYVRVIDQGIGIAKEALPHLWEKGYRAPEARVLRSEGTGIGLSLCKQFVERAGGQVGVESHPGHGSTFWFRLPMMTGRSQKPLKKGEEEGFGE